MQQEVVCLVLSQSTGGEPLYNINNVNVVTDKYGEKHVFPKGPESGRLDPSYPELALIPLKGIRTIYNVVKLFYNARNLVYNETALTKTDFFHQFPRSLDGIIVREGELSVENGGLWYTAPGTIQYNGYIYTGEYEVGVGLFGIYHRNFVPVTKTLIP